MSRRKILNYLRKQIDTAAGLMREQAAEADGKPYPLRPTQNVIKEAIEAFLERRPGADRWWVMPGLRGVGKTTLLAQTYLQLAPKKDEVNLLYLPLDEAAAAGLKLIDILEVYQAEILGDHFENAKKPTFIFIDETQLDAGWALALKSVYDRSRLLFLFCTGSSALNLQMDANVAGRRARIETLHPLSFVEFQLLHHGRQIDEALRQNLVESFYMSPGADEAYQALKVLRPDVNRRYANCKPGSLSAYLQYGSLPFALERSKTLLYRDIRTIINKVLDSDLRAWRSFSASSLTAMPRLLHILATSSDVVSLPKLSQALDISRPQLIQILDALVKAELLIKIPAYGQGSFSSSRRPSKYAFTSTAVRASHFNLTGDMGASEKRRGQLLEDAAALHYRREFITTGLGSLSYPYHGKQARQCDFVLQMGERRLAIEVGLGEKRPDQAASSMRQIKCDYGLVFSQTGLSLDKARNTVMVPLEYFLLA